MVKFLKKYKIWFIGLLIIVVGFLGYRQFGPKPTETVFRTERRTLIESIELSGKIDADQIADLHFQTGGLLTYLPIKEGDPVKKFQTLAALDQRQVQKTLQKYLNLYSVQRTTFEQTEDDYDNQEISLPTQLARDEVKRLLEKNQYQLDNTVLDVELQDLARQYSYLTAPFDGIITNMNVKSPGLNVAITDTFQIVNPESLYFSANIDESDIAKVTEGMETLITLDALPNEEIPSQIVSIAFAAKETSTGTAFESKFSLPDEIISKIRLGFNGTAIIILEEKQDILSLPFEATIEKDDGIYVKVKENGQLVDKKIETGIETGEFVEITSGLSEGEEVFVLE